MAIRERIERGESPEDAQLNARREFGSVGLVKEVTRDMWGWGSIDRFAQDVRYGLRVLRTNRAFAATAIATIALGVGVTTSVFTIADGILFRRLPYAHADRLVVLYRYRVSDGQVLGSVDADAATAFQAVRSFDAIGYWKPDFSDLVAASDDLVRFSTAAVSDGFFETLGVEAALGRLFTGEDFHTGPERPVLLMHSLWQRLGGDPEIVGRTLRLEERTVRIVGVMPASFVFPSWLAQPTALTPNPDPGVPLVETVALPIARLRESVTIAQATAEVTALHRAAAPAGSQPQSGVGVQSVRDGMFYTAQPVLFVLLAAASFVLLIVCANLASLLLARGAERARELAVRTALGATRGRLTRQLVAESLVLAAFGGGLGLALAFVTFDLVYAQVPAALYRVLPAGVDARVMLFALAVSLVAGLIFGAAPAVRLSKTCVSASLRSGRGLGVIPGRWRSGSILVATEVALVVLLLAGAGLMVRSFSRLQSVDLGVNPNGVDLLSVNLPRSRYAASESYEFSRALLERVRRLPGVESAAGLYSPPVSSALGYMSVDLPNAPPGTAQTWPVMSGHFQTFGIVVRAGRTFTEDEVAANAPVAVLTERAALGWPGGDALGKVLQIPKDQPRQIIGIVGDVRVSKRTEGPSMVYVPLHPALLRRGVTEIAVRSRGDREALPQLLIAEARRFDPSVRPTVRSYADLLEAQVAIPRFQTLLFSSFGVIGLVLAACGVLGVVEYVVSRRTQEIGIRMALGARAGHVRLLVLRQAMGPVAVGLTVGLVAASWLTRCA